MAYEFLFGNDTFNWNTDIGLKVEGIPDLGTAQRDGEYITIPGKNRDDYIDHGRYKNVEFSLNVALVQKGSKTVREMIDDVVNEYAYLQGYQYFEDSEHVNLATFAGLTNFGDFRREMRRVGKAVMKFTRDPFWYDVSGLQWQDVPNVETPTYTHFIKSFTNPYKLISKPLIEIKQNYSGSYTLTYYITNPAGTQKSYQVNVASNTNTILIDCEKQTAACDGIPVESTIPDGFESGESVFELRGLSTRITSLKITPRWRCL